jgi:hypothetical protein
VSFLDGDLLLIVRQVRQTRRDDQGRPTRTSLGSVRRWLSRLPRPATHYDDTPWPAMRNYPYGPCI